MRSAAPGETALGSGTAARRDPDSLVVSGMKNGTYYHIGCAWVTGTGGPCANSE